ncbi:MAG: 2'-5' RNA ligase family protein, partial [Planctomycetota bacterium]
NSNMTMNSLKITDNGGYLVFWPDKEMKKKAGDVVLLPDEAVTNKAIKANAELVKKFGSEIVLNEEICLPHISLAMGCIDQSNVGPVEKILQQIAGRCPPGDLTICGVQTSGLGTDTVSVFEVEKNARLQLLHETVLAELQPFLTPDVTADMIYGSGEVAESTIEWIKNYRENSSFENFFPHITIGYGQMKNLPSPIRFAASKLALCHLGNHCTCRRIIVSINL